MKLAGSKVFVFGASSAIAQELQKILANRGASLFLAARDGKKLEAIAQDLRVRGANVVHTQVADATDFKSHVALFERALEALGGLDLVFIAHGTLGDQKRCQQDYALAENEYQNNFLSVVSLLTPAAEYFEKRRGGVIGVISSVAGDRGRQSNYIYGSAKAGLNVFLQGLRHRLAPAGVKVVTFKLGFVDTPMTAHLKKNFLFASPQGVAAHMVKALGSKSGEIYVPWFWRVVMALIKALPNSVFHKTKL